jgi:membrane protease YdiL (CAAX protease family)
VTGAESGHARNSSELHQPMVPLILELIFLFIILPALFAFQFIPFPLLLLFLVTFLWCLGVLLLDQSYDRQQLWNQAALRPHLRRMLITYGIGCVSILAGIILFDRKLLFILVRERPLLWLLLMIVYPVFSVYPQELVYRAFFFHRYKRVFPNRLMMIGASALVFSYMHLVFHNSVAVLLTLAGGILFAGTYSNTRSTFAASFEHALYGCFIFTAGLHSYFLRLDISIIAALDSMLVTW